MTNNLDKLSILDPTLASDIKKWADELNAVVEAHKNNQDLIFGEYTTIHDHLFELKDNLMLLHGYLVSKKVTLSKDEIKSLMKDTFRSFNYINASIKDLGYEHGQVRQINRWIQHTLYGDESCQQP